MTNQPTPARLRQVGITYLGLLFIVIIMSLGLTGAAQLWSTARTREREQELLWVGTQYAKALRSYYNRSPGDHRYPTDLNELLNDNRFPVPQHHLRRLYLDPITHSTDWGLVKAPDGRIAGVYSQSSDHPLKQGNFPSQWEEFADSESYSAWRFVADKALGTAPKKTVTPSSPGNP